MPYQEYPGIKIIPEQSKIWRYITLARLISLLERRQVYFHNIRKQEDRFEGRYTALDFDPEKNPNYKQAFLNARSDIDTEKAKFINSWHISEYESEAMWELYTHKTEGIAIQSTFGRLKDAFKDAPETIYIGKVDYKNRRSELTEISNENGIAVNLTKDVSYEFEKELRALLFLSYQEPERNDFNIGYYVSVDLEPLIEGVYISPFAEYWFSEVVGGILNKYGVSRKKIFSSSLSEKPLY